MRSKRGTTLCTIILLGAGSALAEMFFYDSFEEGGTEFPKWWLRQDNGNPMASVECSFGAREGTHAAKFTFAGKDKRVELSRPRSSKYGSGFVPDGAEVWYGASLYIPKGQNGKGIIMQWHGGNCRPACKSGQTGVPLVLYWSGNTVRPRNIHTTANFMKANASVSLGYNTWIDWVLHIKWTSKSDGICEVWGGKGPLDKNKPLCSIKNVRTLGDHDWHPGRTQHDVYWKCGIYYGGRQTIYYDAMRMGEAFEEVVPGRSPTPLRYTAPAHDRSAAGRSPAVIGLYSAPARSIIRIMLTPAGRRVCLDRAGRMSPPAPVITVQ